MKRLKEVAQLIAKAEKKLDAAQFADAEMIFLQAIELYRRDPEAYYLLGEALCKQSSSLKNILDSSNSIKVCH